MDHFDTWNTITSKGLPFEFVLDETDPKPTLTDSDDDHPSGSSQYFADCSDNEMDEPISPIFQPGETIQTSLPDIDTDSLPLGDATKMGDLLWPYGGYESLLQATFPFTLPEPYMDPNATLPPTLTSTDSCICPHCTAHTLDTSEFLTFDTQPLVIDDTIQSNMLLTAPINPATLIWNRPNPTKEKKDATKEEGSTKTMSVGIPQKRPYKDTTDMNDDQEWYTKKMTFENWRPIVATISFS
ncbi:uncharacterized protein SPPG_05733 [Spizellomyces punctatus DAOM BR117]|uniref:Uncharacterized protein n=1 Tax=Spizellomyces punctatus (strain DAOM BR117) TaxID=645134 RepID=A0A0L0HCQ1_SPIPD|nr:uncharacterized protein SPPG_05733 [Spizellomyces punctatus DAOM BR117]KNC98751.1 hypothetical protein SPPG_05733 [Spizellomyces punctatus DAOM BR117]|eukprot:XP_016606791.1 hypothetical protein SPPG_05733 [Spizellomyces punctatus DAOM BR117]